MSFFNEFGKYLKDNKIIVGAIPIILGSMFRDIVLEISKDYLRPYLNNDTSNIKPFNINKIIFYLIEFYIVAYILFQLDMWGSFNSPVSFLI